MAEQNQESVMTTKCQRCGHDYKDDWGREVCNKCGGKVDIVKVNRKPGTPASSIAKPNSRIIGL